MDESNPSGIQHKRLVQEVCREWLVIEDSALAHQLQDQEIAAHYGHNRERNRIVRGDVPLARTQQEDELKQALALQNFQLQLREQQEKEDEEAARRLAEELEREEELKRRKRTVQDEKFAHKLQFTATKIDEKPRGKESRSSAVVEPLCSKMKMLDMHQPMSEEEAREWQERCDAEMARKLQQEEEEESKFRRDVTDLSRKLALEAKDLELAQMLQEKEKARLRKAKEKARLKAQQAQQATKALHTQEHAATVEEESIRQQNSCFIPETQNIAASIDPTWNRRYHIPDIRNAEAGSRAPIPITDLDFPSPVQPILPGHRRASGPSRSESPSTEPTTTFTPVEQSRNKSRRGCSHQ